ncbi:MAG: DKNYY domain-containing protein [Pikeienuella sp.]
MDLAAAFPLPYAHWYAARLFLDAGHPADETLGRLGMDAAGWEACGERYGQLHFANTGWVASAFRREGLRPPEEDRALFAHLTAHGVAPEAGEPFTMRGALAKLRREVEGDPHIGPFADIPWVARYICERSFPTIRYVHDGAHVRVDGAPICDRKGVPLSGVDPHGFRQLGERWFRDGRRVYGQGETPTKLFWFVARGADADSFVVLNERYGADRAAGYYITNLRLPTEEPGSLEIVSYYYGRGQKPGIHVNESHFAKDSAKVYAYGVAIEGAHAPSFRSIGDEGKYFADRDRIYCENRPMPEADRESFICAPEVGQYRAFDRNRPYYAGEPQSVSAEFESWRAYFEARPEIAGLWWHEEKARREAGAGAQPTPIGGPFFSDGARVLVRPLRKRDGDWVSLDHFDHGSFRHIAGVFGRDRHGLRYFLPGFERYGCDPVKGADPANFAAISGCWFGDGRRIYYLDSAAPMPELAVARADPGSFEVLGGFYARDAEGLLVEGKRKRGIADPGAVVALGHAFARMGEILLYRGKPVSRPGRVDAASARGAHDQLLIDAGGHMLITSRYRKPVPGLDPASFRFLNHSFAVDDARVYAFTGDALLVCPEIELASTRADGRYAVRDRAARFHLSGSSVVRASGA